MSITAEEVSRLKGLGFLQNRESDCFSVRIVPEGTLFTAGQLESIAHLARRFGCGAVSFTSRQCAEVIGIPYEQTEDAAAFAVEHDLIFGGTGPKIRPITACKGTTCIYGNYDTRALSTTLHREYYLGWSGVKLPHKFKIGVGGCPNSCIKPSLNDLGIEGQRLPLLDISKCMGCKNCQIQRACPAHAAVVEDGKLSISAALCTNCGFCVGKCPFGAVTRESEVLYRIYVGGTWGKHAHPGVPISQLVTGEALPFIIEKILLWFRENAYTGERLSQAMARTGTSPDALVANDAVISRKEEILSVPLPPPL
ncbi:4Fe-4S binding protein [Intestinimonas butyriciproducens]|uniref:Dissimilatory sulfite reductase (Desulfoviridin), alpha and beta subunit n=1 Tax=Intestinimonas butyriciproducens TaxID=1297617 RepID=A0A0S2W4S9_9FIRM|nr:4Fe-4S binding protein [Intestinimonas butyriciproducens]ALP94271.1 Dissimilatory sulfite reductase (desulfoviridin), alpha and beta subunit [Intestinimonas butyriciproducens]